MMERFPGSMREREALMRQRQSGRMPWPDPQPPSGHEICATVGLQDRYLSCLDPKLWIYHDSADLGFTVPRNGAHSIHWGWIGC